MAVFKFNDEIKALFLEVYNTPEIPFSEINKVLTEKLQALGFNITVTAEMAREAIEVKLGKLYRKRPRVKGKTREKNSIVFEDDTTNSVPVVNTVEPDEVEELPLEVDVDEEELDEVEAEQEDLIPDEDWDDQPTKTSTYEPHPKEPVQFNF